MRKGELDSVKDGQGLGLGLGLGIVAHSDKSSYHEHITKTGYLTTKLMVNMRHQIQLEKWFCGSSIDIASGLILFFCLKVWRSHLE